MSEKSEAELSSLSLTEASRLVAAREVSPLQLAEACIKRAAALEPILNAYITQTFDTALAEARQATAEIAAGRSLGSLHGLPFALKDLYETAGVRTTAGSRLREDYVPQEDAYVVERLKAAGVVLLGKLNMHEWALGGTNVNVWYPTPRNPWDIERITGGSSGGSGAALAAGLCLGSLGSDTRGSIRIPAALCGVSGLKATYGRVSLRGVVPLNWSLDHSGPLARTAADCALILQTIAGYDEADPTTVDLPVPDYLAGLDQPLTGVRIGLPTSFFFDEDVVQPEVVAAVREAACVFESLGAVVSEVEIPDVAAYSDNGAFMADAGAYHEANLRSDGELYAPVIRSRFEAALELKAIDYSRARYRQLAMKQAFAHLFREIDLLLTPTCPIVAPPIDADFGAPAAGSTTTVGLGALVLRNTAPFNTTGGPVISVPCGFSNEGLPIGLSLAGRDWEEALMLRAAHAYQQSTDWHTRRPAL